MIFQLSNLISTIYTSLHRIIRWFIQYVRMKTEGSKKNGFIMIEMGLDTTNAKSNDEVTVVQEKPSTEVTIPSVQRSDSSIDADSSLLSPADVHGQSAPLISALEVLLFVSDGPVEISHLTKALGQDSETTYAALQELNQNYREQNSGLRIQDYNGRFQLVTHPMFASLIETYLSLDLTTKLSTPALETLAVIAYRQPVTRAQIESVRGVDTSGMLRTLIQRGLIEEAGRMEGAGRPILYHVTEEFMHHFGLTGLDELPPLETTEADTLWAATKLAELEESGQ